MFVLSTEGAPAVSELRLQLTTMVGVPEAEASFRAFVSRQSSGGSEAWACSTSGLVRMGPALAYNTVNMPARLQRVSLDQLHQRPHPGELGHLRAWERAPRSRLAQELVAEQVRRAKHGLERGD